MCIRDSLQAIAAGAGGFLIGVGFTSLGLGLGQVLGATTPIAEAAAIVAGTVAGAVVRFLLLQAWVFRTHTRSSALAKAANITAVAA